MKQVVRIQVEGSEREVPAEMINQKIWFKLDGRIFSYDVSSLAGSASRSRAAAAKSADRILAPMPGKVTKVFVSAGQKVARGDALLVMEAMKMEYTLKADIAASVEKVAAKAGDQVTLGFLLVQLKEEK